MHIRVNDIDDPAVAETVLAEKLRALVEPALANGETVELDFEGVKYFGPLFYYFSIGKLIEADTAGLVSGLLRYTNLSEDQQLALDGGVKLAIRRRDNPWWAKAMGFAAEKMAERE